MRRLALLVTFVAACGGGDPPQHEVTAEGDLLTADGRLREPGWSPRQLQRWNPERVAPPGKLRQWDFFSVQDGAAAVNLTLVDLGFLQIATVGAVDLATGEVVQAMAFAGGGSTFALSDALVGHAELTSDTGAPALAFTSTDDGAELVIDLPASSLGPAAQGHLTIHRRPAMPYLSLATPFDEDPHLFFYEQKLPGMSAEGQVTIGARTWTFAAADTAAVMDWGRGAWPATLSWRWAAAAGTAGGAPFAFNLGEGFGDARAGSENLVIADDVAHKLATVDWTFDPDDPLHDWTFEAPDGRASLVLHPVAPEVGGLDFGAVFSRLHKAYGTFSGEVVLDDGRKVSVDGVPGFAERMDISW